MANSVINTLISIIVSAAFGYCVSIIKNYKKKVKDRDDKDELVKDALVTMLQSTLTSIYFNYEKQKQIPDYVYKNWLNLLSIYEKLGGNDYIHIIAEKMKTWKIISTDILV